MNIYEKLIALGIQLPKVAPSAAVYVPWVATGNLLFVSGHIAKRDGSPWVGQFGTSMKVEDGAAAARSVAIDLLGTVHEALGDLNRVKRVVKLTALVNSSDTFTDHHVVANGASALFAECLTVPAATPVAHLVSPRFPLGRALKLN
ncbi:enamine deaminase RidA (YjgF/YER057c/UK114 family) [Herbaspirillum sp. 1173]|nr:enamine deaminase RidA (YjgF/YER057c/UK114 family) [Herbaspirillum sp. 1173]